LVGLSNYKFRSVYVRHFQINQRINLSTYPVKLSRHTTAHTYPIPRKGDVPFSNFQINQRSKTNCFVTQPHKIARLRTASFGFAYQQQLKNPFLNQKKGFVLWH
jgi:hypothetical protein